MLERWLLASDLYLCLQRDPVYRGYGLQPVQPRVLSGSGAVKAELQTRFLGLRRGWSHLT